MSSSADRVRKLRSRSTSGYADGEYVREGHHHGNTVENYFSILKRGITGTFHHVSEAHLNRYLAEFDFRYSHRAGLGVDDIAIGCARSEGDGPLRDGS